MRRASIGRPELQATRQIVEELQPWWSAVAQTQRAQACRGDGNGTRRIEPDIALQDSTYDAAVADGEQLLAGTRHSASITPETRSTKSAQLSPPGGANVPAGQPWQAPSSSARISSKARPVHSPTSIYRWSTVSRRFSAPIRCAVSRTRTRSEDTARQWPIFGIAGRSASA